MLLTYRFPKRDSYFIEKAGEGFSYDNKGRVIGN